MPPSWRAAWRTAESAVLGYKNRYVSRVPFKIIWHVPRETYLRQLFAGGLIRLEARKEQQGLIPESDEPDQKSLA